MRVERSKKRGHCSEDWLTIIRKATELSSGAPASDDGPTSPEAMTDGVSATIGQTLSGNAIQRTCFMAQAAAIQSLSFGSMLLVTKLCEMDVRFSQRCREGAMCDEGAA